MYSKANLKLAKKLDVFESACVPPRKFFLKGHDEMIPSDKIRVNKSFVQIDSSGAPRCSEQLR
jgi:hypothetical protein